MKKTLLTVAAVALTFALASCGTTDCVCDVEVMGVQADANLSAPEMEDCENVSFSDLDIPADSEWQNWDDSFTLVCEEE